MKGSKQISLSGKRRLVFYLLMFLLPVVVLVGLELLLRLTDYGNSYPLVTKQTLYGSEKYVLNREVGQRYFTFSETHTPQATAEIFDVEKKKNALRIFCLGGSSTAGFPYEMNATFPFQLEFRLRDALFEKHIEVVNLGIAAVNSFTVLDLLPEVLALQPDALLMYMGHNEFYGALGVGSTQHISNNRYLVRLYLKLRRLRLFQLLQNTLSGTRNWFSAEENDSRTSLMAAMAGKQAIPRDSQTFRIAARNFAENLTEIIRQARRQKVPVLLATLVSNIKDQPPFVSKFRESLEPANRERCELLLTEGETALRFGNPRKAAEMFRQILEIDSGAAAVHYHYARAHLALGDTAKAKRHFLKAKDFDQLRFRAPQAFNEIIRETARQEDLPLIDLQGVFAAASPAGIPGRELFLEHLHPNFDGYRLIAQTFLEALRTIQVINPPRPIGWRENLLSAPHLQRVLQDFPKDSAGVTALDLEFGELRNFYLIHRWPFPEQPVTLADYPPHGSEITRRLAADRFRDNTPWETAHYRLADHYLQQGQYDKALREYRAVRLYFLEDFFPLLKIADTYVLKENYEEAYRWYEKALTAAPDNSRILGKLGSVLVTLNRFQEAAGYLEKTLQSDAQAGQLSEEQIANIYYLLGASYANLRQWEAAREALDKALRLQPDFPAAQKFRATMEAYLDQQNPGQGR